MGVVKICKTISKCSDCDYICHLVEDKGNVFYAALCVYPEFISVLVCSTSSTKHLDIDIPVACPLADYNN